MQYAHVMPGEYACLKPDLSGPLAMAKHVVKEGELRRLQQELAGLEGVLEPDRLQDYVEKAIAGKLAERRVDDERRRAVLYSHVEEVRRQYQRDSRVRNGILNERAAQAVEYVIRLYTDWDRERFVEDFQHAYQKASDSKSKIQGLRMRIGKLESRLEKAKWEPYFRRVPNTWRDWSLKTIDAERMCEIVLRKFLDDWRLRQRWFSVPVTVNTVPIHQLPGETRDVWEAAWKELKLDEQLARTNRFKPRRVE